MARGPFHDGVRAAVLFRAGHHRHRQRPLPAEPGQPDQRALQARRSAHALRPTTSTMSASTSADSSHPSSAAPSASSMAGIGASRWPASAWSSASSSISSARRYLPREQGVPQRTVVPRRERGSPGASTAIIVLLLRRRTRSSIIYRSAVRAGRQHRCAVGGHRRRSQHRRLDDSDDLVPVVESARHLPLHAGHRRMVEMARQARSETVPRWPRWRPEHSCSVPPSCCSRVRRCMQGRQGREPAGYGSPRISSCSRQASSSSCPSGWVSSGASRRPGSRRP